QRTGAPSPAWRKGSSSSSQASPSAVAISDENCAGSPADRSMTERMRSSGTRMLPAESVTAWEMPRSGVWLHRPPSRPGDGSSVTAERSESQPRRAEAIRAPEPAGARQQTSARTRPGAAGWVVQSKRACAPMAPPAAHSMCGQSARGAEWTKSTPCVISICASYLGYVFPYDPKGGADHMIVEVASAAKHQRCWWSRVSVMEGGQRYAVGMGGEITDEDAGHATIRMFPDYADTVLWFGDGPVEYSDTGLTAALIDALQRWEQTFYESRNDDLKFV